MVDETRRHFLQKSIAGLSVGTAAPALLGQERTKQAAASERIGIGCVGVGGRAGSLLRMFAAQEDVDIVAIADIDARRIPEAVAMVKRVTGKSPETHEDFRKLLDIPAVDALVVGTPDHWHAIPTILGCLAGKDVYVEKPDGHNMVEGQRMVAAMRKHGRVVQMGTQSRTSAHFHEAMEFIRSGQLGTVLVAKAWESMRQGSIGHPPDGTPPPGVNYDMWLGPAPKRPFNPRRFHGSWRWFFDYGTGDLGNDGVHRIDVARSALATAVEAQGGRLPTLPSKISAIGGKWYFDDIQEWPDTLQVSYEFPGEGKAPGRILTYEMRIWAPYPYTGEREGSLLYGDQGYIVIGNRHWRAHSPDGELLAEGSGNNDGETHIRNFLDCVKSRERPNADLETVGHPTSLLCHAGNVAWRVGRQLQLDPKTETFHDDQADALRTRPVYRRPWELPEV